MSVRMCERIQQLYSEVASLRQRCNYKVIRLEKLGEQRIDPIESLREYLSRSPS